MTRRRAPHAHNILTSTRPPSSTYMCAGLRLPARPGPPHLRSGPRLPARPPAQHQGGAHRCVAFMPGGWVGTWIWIGDGMDGGVNVYGSFNRSHRSTNDHHHPSITPHPFPPKRVQGHLRVGARRGGLRGGQEPGPRAAQVGQLRQGTFAAFRPFLVVKLGVVGGGTIAWGLGCVMGSMVVWSDVSKDRHQPLFINSPTAQPPYYPQNKPQPRQGVVAEYLKDVPPGKYLCFEAAIASSVPLGSVRSTIYVLVVSSVGWLIDGLPPPPPTVTTTPPHNHDKRTPTNLSNRASPPPRPWRWASPLSSSRSSVGRCVGAQQVFFLW